MVTQNPSLNTRAFHSMRDWIAHLEKTKRLVRAKKGVPLKYTLAAIAKQLDGEKAVLFPNPDHHPIAVVSGIVSKRDWIAETMGISNNMLLKHFREAVLNPIPWREIQKAPCQEIVIGENIDINSILPIPTHNENDSGAYITAGLVIARNPQSGEQNVLVAWDMIDTRNTAVQTREEYDIARSEAGNSFDMTFEVTSSAISK